MTTKRKISERPTVAGPDVGDKKGRVLSGARPTGRLHLGNYFGALQNWVGLQDDYDCFYFVADVHALTTAEDTQDLSQNTREMVLDWLAAGLDPERSALFVQSHVPEVMELHTYLSMITPMGWVQRVPSFKEQMRLHPEGMNYGLVGYPVLQTADIIMYKADTVPVGQDQVPHVELAREISRRFNDRFGPVFPEPQSLLSDVPIIRGLDGENKMSKSLGNHIELAATPEETTKRVMSMVTDPQRQYRKDPGRPWVCNVFALHAIFSSEEWRKEVDERCQAATIGCVDDKQSLAENINTYLEPFRERRRELAAKPQVVDEALAAGDARARAVAREVIGEVRERIGFFK
jgi:tryptophanyl-tRNA synthetase